jgi:hypothetical protein
MSRTNTPATTLRVLNLYTKDKGEGGNTTISLPRILLLLSALHILALGRILLATTVAILGDYQRFYSVQSITGCEVIFFLIIHQVEAYTKYCTHPVEHIPRTVACTMYYSIPSRLIRIFSLSALQVNPTITVQLPACSQMSSIASGKLSMRA